MDTRLHDTVAMITGAGSGIGVATMPALLNEDAPSSLSTSTPPRRRTAPQ